MNRNLHWRRDREFNFGDRLSPLLYFHLTGHQPRWVEARRCEEQYFTLVGSFLEIVNRNAQVWGTGLLHSDHRPCPAATYHAVRGPLTREKILRSGGSCPEIYGDPVSLLPWFYPLSGQRGTIGVIPHWRERSLACFRDLPQGEMRILNVTAGVEEFLQELSACEVVLSSSLHGLVAAHAYGIPALWIAPSQRPLGDGMKFRDYLASVDLFQQQGARFQSPGDLLRLADRAKAPVLNLQPFWEAFPGDVIPWPLRGEI